MNKATFDQVEIRSQKRISDMTAHLIFRSGCKGIPSGFVKEWHWDDLHKFEAFASQGPTKLGDFKSLEVAALVVANA